MSEEFHGCDDPRTTPVNVGDKVWVLFGKVSTPAVVTGVEGIVHKHYRVSSFSTLHCHRGDLMLRSDGEEPPNIETRCGGHG